MKKIIKYSLYFFIGFLSFKACTTTEPPKPKTFYGNVQFDMFSRAEKAVKKLVKYPETYEEISWVSKRESDSTGFYHITFTSKNAFGVPIRNTAQVEFKYDLEEYTGAVTRYFIIK